MTKYLALLFLFAFLSLAQAHSYVICTDYKIGDKTCPDTHPYYPSAQHPKKADISHDLPGTFFKPVDDGQPGVFFSIDLASKMPSANPGQKLNLVWPADRHASTFPPYNETGGKFWDIWVTTETNPDDAIFDTPMYTQLNYSNCFDKDGVDWTGQSSIVCSGEITIPKDSRGVTTFVMGWNLNQSKFTKYNLVSAFQYNVIDSTATLESSNPAQDVTKADPSVSTPNDAQQLKKPALAAEKETGQQTVASCNARQPTTRYKNKSGKQSEGKHSPARYKDYCWGWNAQTAQG